MPRNKTDNFLKAIKRYAKQQKNAMQGEVEQLKSERLKEAEAQARAESDRIIKDELSRYQTKHTALLAAKTQEGQKKLFLARSEMVEEVFALAAERLTAYTATDAYQEKLRESARQMAALFGEKPCVLSVNSRDVAAAEQLKDYFGGGAEIRADKTIAIGGVRGYCAEMGIIADETFDAKLEAQREWFIENAALSVL